MKHKKVRKKMNVYMRNASIGIDVVKENRLYSLSIPIGAEYAEAEEVLDELGKQVQQMKEMAAKKAEEQKEKKADSAPVEDKN